MNTDTTGSVVQEIPFAQALEDTKALERDLLLGNGFSIGAHEAFAYDALLEKAVIPEDVLAVFATARTSNFEAVMRILLAESGGASPRAAAEAQRKIDTLKDALVNALHDVHPERRTRICGPRWERCEQFLEHFIGRKRTRDGRIFTTNYDLLLCWAIAPDRDRIRPEKRFRSPYEGFAYGAYNRARGVRGSNIIYLHGALHLYAKEGFERQRQYRDSGVPLHEQIAAALTRGERPIFVSEGAASMKEPKEPGYLKDALRAFQGTCDSPTKKALFTLGHGLGPEDSHILGLIPQGKIPAVYLGAYGRKELKDFYAIAESWIAARARTVRPPLRVYIFDSTDLVWGPRKDCCIERALRP